MSQLDLFSGQSAKVEPVYTTDPDNVRKRLARILSEMRTATAMPWRPSDERMFRNIVPQMTNWLPADEAEDVKAQFAAELERLARPC